MLQNIRLQRNGLRSPRSDNNMNDSYVKIRYYIQTYPASRGLSRRGKMKREERDLCRLPTSCLMKPPTKFLVETYRF